MSVEGLDGTTRRPAMTTAPFLSRHLGDYLLVAQLGEDALGTVFRALYAADDRRFVRLRLLRSEELSPAAIAWAIQENAIQAGSLVHEAIVVRPQLDVVEDIPFMTWDEAAGWTLDAMLARVRAFGIRIPSEYALLMAERIAAALEHAHQTPVDDRPGHHGLLWPGFVSISHEAALRVGGFGIAEGVLPSLSGVRMTAEIAPYIAPEVRRTGTVGANSDVYSLGAILVEMMTGRRPSLETPSAELRANDPRSDELGGFLKRCLAGPDDRFASAVDAHRSLQRMLTGNPYSLYTANLALFLYKLLNPESQSVAPSSDWESTNPVVVPAAKPAAEEAVAPPVPEAAPQSIEGKSEGEEATAPGGDRAAACEEAPAEAPEEAPAAPPAEPAPEVAPVPVQVHAAGLLEDPPAWRTERPAPGWTPAAAGLAAAAGLVVAIFLIASQLHSARPEAPRSALAPRSVTGREAAPVPAARPAPPAPAPAPIEPIAAPAPAAAPPLAPQPGLERASQKSEAPARPRPRAAELRQPAENVRLRAALARIEAERVGVPNAAGDLIGEGRQREEEGERLMRQRDYDAARHAFLRAAELFARAQTIRWETRVRQADLSTGK